MPFCSNCGMKLNDNAKFCSECGASAVTTTGSTSGQRRQEYVGKICKCPNCGEVLQSYENRCSACGYELRGVSATESVQEFARRLEHAASKEQRVVLIRNFPIPNAKEDILDFMILAASNIKSETDKEIFDAWIATFEQAYQKARILFKNDAFLAEIQSVYDQTCKTIQYGKAKRLVTTFGKGTGRFLHKNLPVLPNMIVCAAWIISLFVLIALCKGQRSGDGYNMFLFFDFIAGVIVIPFVARCKSPIPKLIITIGLVLSIAVIISLSKGNPDSGFQVLLFFDIVATAIILPIIFIKKREK